MYDIPTEYHGAIAGVFAGYVADSLIEHNTIERASYTGKRPSLSILTFLIWES